MAKAKKSYGLQTAIIIIALLLTAGVGGLISGGSDDAWYAGLVKPPLNPPDITFAVVWPILYILMGVSAVMVLKAAGGILMAQKAFGIFFLQLALNTAWSWLFFFFHRPTWALLDIIFLFILILMMFGAFWRWSKPAAFLQMPYILWVMFATYLNAGIVYLN